ncbi:hypothetical protein FMM68_07505 [Lachnospiraceae bacterium MD329]|nr:hypothetical protein [Lachnospiraceae bacterium MD329]
MSDVKERIVGAVTVMSETDANTLWKLIIDNFSEWENIKEIVPDETDVKMLQEIEADTDCHTFMSSDTAMKELGL